MKNVIFDTNSIYYLDTTIQDKTNHLTDNEFETLKKNTENGNLNIFISPISVIEMSSRLISTPNDFNKVQNSLKKMFCLCPKFLPDPEQMFNEYMTNHYICEQNYAHWEKISELIKDATSISALQNSFPNGNGVNLKKISRFRDEYEKQYIEDMKNYVLIAIPNFDERRLKGSNTRLSKNELVKINNCLNSTNWINSLKLMLVERGQAKLDAIETTLLNKIYFFEKSYKKLLSHTFQQGYQPQNNKNDYNDLHFNVYFNNDNDYIFITSENNVVFDELKNSNRCITLKNLCNSFKD
jgi:hypothetical protein